ncbi:hypothetical protein I552_1817 [Mycobacterium xenopi 3993]|nr:hypothetical protein I552_1817 [Mycobacterium xenopi 3993]
MAERSPHFRDGAFVNIDPASLFSLDREQQQLILREIIGGLAATRPPVPIPLARPGVIDSGRAGWRSPGSATPPRCWRSTVTGC